MLLTENGLSWKQPRRRIYESIGGTGKYILYCQTGDLRKCRLYFLKDSGYAYIDQILLSIGRVKNLMLVAEIHDVTHP